MMNATTSASGATGTQTDKPLQPLEGSSKEQSDSCPAGSPPLSSPSPLPVPSSSQLSPNLALIPLRPASKKKQLEVKQLPIVLGRTNLAQWWYQSCDCQHYYCRLHCRPVAQNIGSLSKVMIQIDTAGKVHVVGKNPHLVTITPERKDQILQVNDILSIGRRDREPWMRFQVVKNVPNSGGNNNSNNNKSSNTNSLAQNKLLGTTGGARTGTSMVKRSNSKNGVGDEALQQPGQKRQKTMADKQTMFGNKSSSNGSSGISKNIEGSIPPTAARATGATKISSSQNLRQVQQQQQQPQPPQLQVQQEQVQQQPLAQQRAGQQQLLQHNGGSHDGQLPEWITTTTGKRNRGNRSPSSLSAAQGTNSKQQQHQAIVARLARAAAAANVTANAISAPPGASFSHKQHHHQEASDSNAVKRKRRRRNGSQSNRDNNSSSIGGAPGGPFKAIRSAEDLFNVSRPHHPQIHLVFQDYENSAKLVQATQRTRPLDVVSNVNEGTVRQARTDRNFISKPGEGPYGSRGAPISPRTTESGGEEQPEQLGLLSKNFAAALLGAAAPAPAAVNIHNEAPPVVIQGEKVVVRGEDTTEQQPKQDKQQQQEHIPQDAQARAGGGGSRSYPKAMQRSDSATCRAALAKYAAEKEAAAQAKKREKTAQSQGEKTSEIECQDDVARNTPSLKEDGLKGGASKGGMNKERGEDDDPSPNHSLPTPPLFDDGHS